MSSNSLADGTVILTGANGSLALSFVECLLERYSSYLVILTVRDDSAADENTNELRKIVSRFPSAEVLIEPLDHSSLSDVRSFAESVTARISVGTIPRISAIICNAFSWSLKETKYSKDGYELGFQVSHLAHFALVLKLLGSVNPHQGRVVLLGSEAHDSNNKNNVNPLGAKIPDDLEELIKPKDDKKGEEMSRGFQRYSNSKLSNVMFMHSLNKKLQSDPRLKDITVVAVDPGNMPTSRCFNEAPVVFKSIIYVIGRFMLPISQHVSDTFVTTKTSAQNLVLMSVGEEMHGARGYYSRQKSEKSSLESQDERLQENLWLACEKWASLDPAETALE